ncbi:MAG: DUF3570 domain-containing protein [Deltaproteobacteria bacterium]|nr:DUF3570 domain-containing protein [Deltaproteobacteria bacterium]
MRIPRELVATLAALSGLLACASSAWAQAEHPVRTVIKVNYYDDNDGNRIVTPVTSIEGSLGKRVTVHAHAAYDIMTCASVDVVTAASPKGYFQEVRQEYEGGAAVRLGLTTLSGSATWSHENDYSSISVGLGAATELFQRNTTLTFGYGYAGSSVGRSGDPHFDESLDSHTLTASVSQLLSKRLIAQAGWFFNYSHGYQQSPYRAVSLVDGTFTTESAPEDRLRQSWVARLRGAFSTRWFLAGDYRLYFDTWGMMGHTVQAMLSNTPLPWFEWRLRARFYAQSGADFYQQTYDRLRQYMTADRELGPFIGITGGLKLGFNVTALPERVALSFDLKSDVTWQRFSEFELLPERIMVVTEAGMHLDF